MWAEVAPQAGIEVLQRGAVVVARRPEALAVLEEFAEGEMGEGCTLWSATECARQLPRLRAGIAGALASPHELRVEAREALPRLARWLAQRHGVAFTWGATVLGVDGTTVRHSHGLLDGDAVVVAPGGWIAPFAAEIAQRVNLRDCKLQMMRIAPNAADFRLPAVVMSDLSLLRYEGFATLGSAGVLHARLAGECKDALAHGVHLIVAQGADGSLVVGDSHHYGALPDPFSSAAVDELILAELRALFDIPEARVIERWLGHYPVANLQPLLSVPLAARVQLVAVTGGTGMSTAFAIGEETISALFR